MQSNASQSLHFFQAPVATLDHQAEVGDQLIALVGDHLSAERERDRYPGMPLRVPAFGDSKKVDLEAILEPGRRLKEAIGLIPENVDHVQLLRVGQCDHVVPEIALVGYVRIDIALALRLAEKEAPTCGGKGVWRESSRGPECIHVMQMGPEIRHGRV
jgi:hypothetical protein